QDQQFLLPPSLNEWVRKDHPARVFSDIISQCEVSGFQEIKHEGRPRYDTKMMLKILLWGYANGIRSSRKIEERLYADVIFMWLSGLEKPDFRTICLFRKTNLEKLNYLFSQVILLAKGLKLVRLGLIALDGTKVRAHAGIDSFKKVKDWDEELKQAQEQVRQILSEAEASDLADDGKYGAEFRGNELPKGLERAEVRIKKIEGLMKEIKAKGKDDNQRVSNTDSDAGFMHHRNGSIPAYNCEVVATKDQIIIHSDVTVEPVDTNQLIPALDGIKNNCGKKPGKVLADAGFNQGKNFRELEKRKINGYIPEGSEKNIGQDIRRDTGLYSKDNFEYKEETDCYICPAGEVLKPKSRSHCHTKYSDKFLTVYSTAASVCLSCGQKGHCTKSQRRLVVRGEFEAERLRMRQKLKSEEGKAIYKRRKTIVEPVIGQIKVVGGFIQFLLRGLMGAKIEWKWATIAHNLLKITRKIIRGERELIPVTG
ncbi:IS1182 family transposase, partial [Planctomycetota bacterium]